jgi:OmpA-OmpF porin, OOP family
MRHAVVALCCVSLMSFAAGAAEKKGHPLITPYQGSTLNDQGGNAFDQVTFLAGRKADGSGLTQTVEGKSTYLEYKNPSGRTAFEVSKNYENALKAAGFTIVHACAGNECPQVCQIKGINCAHEGGTRYVLARLVRPAEGNVWTAVKSSDYGTMISIIEEKPMETGMVSVNASALKKGIESDGHIAVYGIVFDTNKADLKPQADPIIAEIAKLLKDNPSLRLHVVGHTDNVGDFTSNMDLSRRRAAFVVQALLSRHGIAANRLHAEGVGSLVPLTTNRNEAGRAKNRRVDLVEQ